MLLNFDNFDSGGPLTEDYGYVQNASLYTSGYTRLRTTTLMADGFQNGVYEGFASIHRTGVKGVWADFTVAGDGASAVIQVWQGDPFLEVRPVGTALQVWTVNDGTVLTATGALPSISAGNYYRVELKWTVSSLDAGNALNYDGSIELKVNDVTVGSISNIRLGFALPVGYTRDVFWNVVVFNPHGDGSQHYLCNGAGSLNTDFMPTNVEIFTSRPASDGSFSQLTPSTGTAHAALVDDTASDGDTTYLSGLEAAKSSSFNFADFSSIGTKLVHGLRHVAVGKKTESGFRRFRSYAYRSGVQQFASVDYPIGVDYFAWMQHVYELDPYTNRKWTVDTVNASEFGVLVG